MDVLLRLGLDQVDSRTARKLLPHPSLLLFANIE